MIAVVSQSEIRSDSVRNPPVVVVEQRMGPEIRPARVGEDGVPLNERGAIGDELCRQLGALLNDVRAGNPIVAARLMIIGQAPVVVAVVSEDHLVRAESLGG